MRPLNVERVLSVHHWTDTLFSFKTTRDRSLRFKNGHFLMVGLEIEGHPLLSAYSVASANYEEHLEFYSIKVPDGPLTSRLQHLRPGDSVLMSRKPTGTLVVDHLEPGRRLYLLGTGTGLAPFMSIIRDPDTYERFETVVVVHGVRYARELAYSDFIQSELPKSEFIGDVVQRQLRYHPTVTREPFRNRGRITTWIDEGGLRTDLGLPELNAAQDRVMICGSTPMLRDVVTLLGRRGFAEGSGRRQGQYVVERAFVE